MLIRSMGVEKEEPNVKKSLRSFFFMNLSMPVYSNTFYVVCTVQNEHGNVVELI